MTRPSVVLLPPLGHRATIYGGLAERLAPEVEIIGLDYPLATLDLDAPDLLGHLADRMVARIAARAPAAIGGISIGATLTYLLAGRLGAGRLLLMAPGGPPVASTRREGVLAKMAELGDEEFARRHLGPDSAPARATCALLRAALAADLAAEMGRLTAAIDVVWGTDDRLFNARHQERVRRLLPPHRTHVLEGVGHLAVLEAPDRVAGVVRAALEIA
jgi:pimeloyl-ACP methyl ester carboxylesterase